MKNFTFLIFTTVFSEKVDNIDIDLDDLDDLDDYDFLNDYKNIEKIILTPPSAKLPPPPPKICTSNGHPVFKPDTPLKCTQNFFSLPMANQIDCTKNIVKENVWPINRLNNNFFYIRINK